MKIQWYGWFTSPFLCEEAASNRCSSHIDGGILKQVKWMKIQNSQCKDNDNEKMKLKDEIRVPRKVGGIQLIQQLLNQRVSNKGTQISDLT